jgi:DNA invertase Pin-like site-specific DNA recombinase
MLVATAEEERAHMVERMRRGRERKAEIVEKDRSRSED